MLRYPYFQGYGIWASDKTGIVQPNRQKSDSLISNHVYSPLKLLFLANDPKQEALLKSFLHEAGYDLHHRCMRSMIGFERTLQDNSWDIVVMGETLTDHHLPDVLHYLKMYKQHVPLIIFGEETDEKALVKAQLASADHYIVPDAMHRLLPIIERIKGAPDSQQGKNSHQSLVKKCKRLESIIASAMDAIVTADQQQHIILMNKAAEELFGYQAADVIGKPLAILLPERYHDLHHGHLSDFMKSGKTRRSMGHARTLYALKADGTEFPVEASISRIQTDQEYYFTAILRDVSLKTEAEKTEKRLNAELVQQNEQLQQFGYITSHNIRGPVATILGLVNLLEQQLEGTDETAALDILKLLETTAAKLDQVVIDMNKILEHRACMGAVKEPVSLQEILVNVKSGLSSLMDGAQAIIEDNFQVQELYSIRSYIHSILYSLLSNAIKFRDAKRTLKICVSSTLAQHDSQDMVCISVADNGLGIDLKAHGKRIFGLYKRFHQHVEGRGLGLHILKTQVEALHGQVEVNSEVGVGSTFRVYLPYEKFDQSKETHV